MIERTTVTEDVSTRVMQTMQRFPTYTLSAVTLRMSMTSHSPEVIGVALPCMNELEKCHRKKKMYEGYCNDGQDSWKRCGTGLPLSTYSDHVMDVLVPIGVALQQVIAVLVCGKNWFWWRELERTSLLARTGTGNSTFVVGFFFSSDSHLLLVHTRPTQPVGLFTSRFCKRYRIVFFFIAVPVTILQLYNIKIHRPYQFKARSEFRDCLADREFPTTGCYNTWNIFTQMNVIEAAAINWISVWSLTALSYKVCRLTG